MPEVERDGPLAVRRRGGWYFVLCDECGVAVGPFRHRSDAEDAMDVHDHTEVDNPRPVG
jgi:hypothetical protein